MTLAESTEIALVAIRAKDLDALSIALNAREQTIKAYSAPTPEIVKKGETMIAALTELKQQLAIENAFLEQVRMGYLR